MGKVGLDPLCTPYSRFDPTASISELEEFSSAEDTVAIVELKHSRKSTLSSWQELCTRYHIPVIGIVSTEKCW